MKTLDEVIELSERCTLPYPGDCLNCEYFEDETGYDCRCKIIADALFYLKEYQKILPLVPSLINTAIAVQKKGKTIG